MTTNPSETPSIQRASGPCCVIGCSLLYDHAHNARLERNLYGHRRMAETAFSVIKRRFGPAVHPCAWYREFRELVLTATVYNLEQATKG